MKRRIVEPHERQNPIRGGNRQVPITDVRGYQILGNDAHSDAFYAISCCVSGNQKYNETSQHTA